MCVCSIVAYISTNIIPLGFLIITYYTGAQNPTAVIIIATIVVIIIEAPIIHMGVGQNYGPFSVL